MPFYLSPIEPGACESVKGGCAAAFFSAMRPLLTDGLENALACSGLLLLPSQNTPHCFYLWGCVLLHEYGGSSIWKTLGEYSAGIPA